MPNILLEAMASALPVACSRAGPMPEVLGDAGIYFDPEKPNEIADAIRTLKNSPALRSNISTAAYNRAMAFSWDRCAHATFDFMRDTFQEFRRSEQRARQKSPIEKG
jgi:glycosyltransferase involved in cell wall biosynthesis